MGNDEKVDSKKRVGSKNKEEEKKESESKSKQEESLQNVGEPFKKVGGHVHKRKRLKPRQKLRALIRLVISVVTLAGLIVHGCIEPSNDDMKRIIDRGAIPAAFGSDMLLEFSLVFCIFFQSWIHPAIAIAIDATQIFLLACSILVVTESLFYAFKIILVDLACVAIALHIYLIVKETIHLKKLKKAVRESKMIPEKDSKGSSMPSSFASSTSRSEPPEHEPSLFLRESRDVKPSKESPAKTYAKRMEEEERKIRKSESLSAPAKRFREMVERQSTLKASRLPSASSKRMSETDRKTKETPRNSSIAPTQKSVPNSPKTSTAKVTPLRGVPQRGLPKTGPPSKSI